MRVGVAITKGCQWHGQLEEFSNVYNYDVPALTQLALNEADLIIDRLVALEKAVHSSNVSFLEARVWTRGQGAAQNETIRIRDLSGTGTMSASESLYREACIVVRLNTGRNSTTGRRIFLRKYIHATNLPTAGSLNAAGVSVLTAAQKQPFQTYGEAIRKLEVAGLATDIILEAPGGQNLAENAVVSVLDYVHTRQFRR